MRRIILFIIIVIVIIADMVTGRAISNGLDALIPRGTTSHPAPHRVEITLENGKTAGRDIWCEDYYDAQGGLRGNFWAVRERGMQGVMDASRERISVDGVGVVSFVMPTCADLTKGGGFSVSQLVLLVNGVVYGHRTTQGDSHTFIARHAHEGEDVVLDFALMINGRKIK